jgi:Cys-tRNA(Pro)/Cys-tRNA(Cys) deacylase
VKTNAARLLDSLGIAYELREYEIDEEDLQLDLKALARLSGDRSIDPVPLKEVQPLTGYVRGGVTILGAKKSYPAFADETVELFDVISVSAGVRGTQLLLAPADYLRATNARLGPIARPG